ncbi:MAG: adenine nucleotide alpha hydrolase [Desulfobacteraceae bacterium]|jgi:uncharacterized protein (TIGR00290 family)
MAKRTLLSWSSGKDSAFALFLLRKDPDIEVEGLFTTVNSTHGRVAMHAVTEELLQVQTKAINLPLRKLEIPYPCSNVQYEAAMSKFVSEAKSQGIVYMAFGDVFLEDIRKYREDKLEDTGITPMFPLWGMRSGQLAREMIDKGFRMIITCVDPRHVSKSFIGREFDESFLNDLPPDVDPCGEKGEFHTFVYDGPIFLEPLSVKPGRIVEREGFVFGDVILGPIEGSISTIQKVLAER